MKKQKAPSTLPMGLAIIFGFLFMLLLLWACGTAIMEDNAVYEYNDIGVWHVEEGDTLWEIASFYSDNRHDVRKVIDIIKCENPGLIATIYPGQSVWVPLFECMDWEMWEE